jgi:Putative membrane protein insertion efficiency factor
LGGISGNAFQNIKLIPSILFLSLVAVLVLQAAGSGAEARWEEPWGKKGSAGVPGQVAAQPPSAGQKAAGGLIGIFREYISPVDGDRCPMYPTCSQYSLEAIRKHGVAIGFVMTFDRLMHESDEIRRTPQVKIYDSYRYYDPVENNDFWWNK